jgi:hypothetical protein
VSIAIAYTCLCVCVTDAGPLEMRAAQWVRRIVYFRGIYLYPLNAVRPPHASAAPQRHCALCPVPACNFSFDRSNRRLHRVPRVFGFNVTWILVLGTSLWAAVDSSKIQLKRYESGISYGPIVLFIGCALL